MRKRVMVYDTIREFAMVGRHKITKKKVRSGDPARNGDSELVPSESEYTRYHYTNRFSQCHLHMNRDPIK
jgi:hypothetical protein